MWRKPEYKCCSSWDEDKAQVGLGWEGQKEAGNGRVARRGERGNNVGRMIQSAPHFLLQVSYHAVRLNSARVFLERQERKQKKLKGRLYGGLEEGTQERQAGTWKEEKELGRGIKGCGSFQGKQRGNREGEKLPPANLCGSLICITCYHAVSPWCTQCTSPFCPYINSEVR